MPGGGGSPPTELVTVIQHEAASILSGVDPTSGAIADYDTSLNAHDALSAAHSSSGGNPYTLIESWDSDDELAAVDTEFEEYDASVDALDPATDIAAAIAIALAEVDGDLDLDPATSTQVGNMVTAMQDASKIEMLKDVSRAMTGMYDIRAVMTTQMGMAVGQIEHQRGLALADQEARLRMQTLGMRTESMLQLANTFLMEKQKQVEQERLDAALRSDIARTRIIAEMDRIEFDVKMESKDSLYDLELFAYYGNLIASMTGAASIPRAMTERERVLNAVTTSASAGIQAGQALGSPGGGALFGVASLAMNLWGQGRI